MVAVWQLGSVTVACGMTHDTSRHVFPIPLYKGKKHTMLLSCSAMLISLTLLYLLYVIECVSMCHTYLVFL